MSGRPKPDLLLLMKWAVSRISYHVEGCRGGTFASCKCANAVTVRRLERAIKAHDPEYVTELEIQEHYDEQQRKRDEARRRPAPAEETDG